VELGCGTGLNLFVLRKYFKNKKLTGCDWSPASQKIVDQINCKTASEINSVNLDLSTMRGWNNIIFDSNTGILTVHAFEQIGSNIDRVLSKILKLRPKICVHLEPIIELYNKKKKFDKIAIDYHTKRNYLTGFYSKLNEMQNKEEIEIVKVCRTGFGSTFQEAYTLIVWRVL
jgi:hypothetical protein